MMCEEILIRPANVDDADTLVEFNIAMALETENRRLDPMTVREGTVAFLKRPQYGFYIVAELPNLNEHRPVGQLMVTYEWSDWRNGVFWWIQSVYVLPDRRRLGVFRAMHDDILVKAKAAHQVCGIRLYVDQDNCRAQTVYQHVGLAPSRYTVFEQDFVLGYRKESR